MSQGTGDSCQATGKALMALDLKLTRVVAFGK